MHEEIQKTRVGRPHVVILGAGATLASFPNGDRNGKKIPLMNNLVETLGLENIIKKTGIAFDSNNFEQIYDRIAAIYDLSSAKLEIEKRVYEYFSSLVIHASPTIYDTLLLSLRPKDVIATFNWDPLLFQAYKRNKP